MTATHPMSYTNLSPTTSKEFRYQPDESYQLASDIEAVVKTIDELRERGLREDTYEGVFLRNMFEGDVVIEEVPIDEASESIFAASNSVVNLLTTTSAVEARLPLGVAVAQFVHDGNVLAQLGMDGLDYGIVRTTPLFTFEKISPVRVKISMNRWVEVEGVYRKVIVPDFTFVMDAIAPPSQSGTYFHESKKKKSSKGKGPFLFIASMIAVAALALALARNANGGSSIMTQPGNLDGHGLPSAAAPLPANVEEYVPPEVQKPPEVVDDGPIEEPLNVNTLGEISQAERISMVPDVEKEISSGLEMYASNLRPDVVLAFDAEGNPVKAWNILEEKWVNISDVSGVDNGSRGKDWSEVGVQVYRMINGDYMETPFITPVPIENGVKTDLAARLYPTFSNPEDLFEYVVNVEGAKYSMKDIIEFSKSDPGGFTASVRETLYRQPSSMSLANGDFTTPDGKATFSMFVYYTPSATNTFVILYTDSNGFSHYCTLVLGDSTEVTQLREDLLSALQDPLNVESIIPRAKY